MAVPSICPQIVYTSALCRHEGITYDGSNGRRDRSRPRRRGSRAFQALPEPPSQCTSILVSADTDASRVMNVQSCSMDGGSKSVIGMQCLVYPSAVVQSGTYLGDCFVSSKRERIMLNPSLWNFWREASEGLLLPSRNASSIHHVLMS